MDATLQSRRIVVATAGHVDHGKTSLVRALTGVDTDRLPEEKRRGISIELGFAELGGAPVSFIDVPGHERLVHTMIAGVGGVDALLLVVAADDGVMPQTREHLAVCSVLGLRRVLVALTKCDLVDAELQELAEADVLETLARFGMDPIGVVRTSTATSAGLAELDRMLRSLVARVPARAPSQRTWLSVDRAFSLRGAGTIVTGTLTRGALCEGDVVYVSTDAAVVESACRGLELHGRRVSEAAAPTRIAINLARVDLRAVARGDVVTKDPELPRCRRLDACVEWLPSALSTGSRRGAHHAPAQPGTWRPGIDHAPAQPGTCRPLLLMVHLGTTRAQARVESLGERTAHLVLDRSVPCEGGLGVVLRGLTAQPDFGRIVGGGRVLDAGAPPPPRRRAARAFELRVAGSEALASGDLAGGLLGLVRASAPRPIVDVDVERRLGLEPGGVASLLGASGGRCIAVLPDGLAARGHGSGATSFTTPEAMVELVDTATAHLGRYHAGSPHELGAPIETIRTALARAAGRPAAAQALALAVRSGRIQTVDPGTICLPEFATASAQTHDDAVERVRATLDLAALAGASEKEVTERSGLTADRTRAALARLATQGEARRLSALWFGEARLASLRVAVRAHLRSHGAMSVPAFKELFSVSRKQAIPLLEDLDHQGVTRRQGDDRVLGPAGGG